MHLIALHQSHSHISSNSSSCTDTDRGAGFYYAAHVESTSMFQSL